MELRVTRGLAVALVALVFSISFGLAIGVDASGTAPQQGLDEAAVRSEQPGVTGLVTANDESSSLGPRQTRTVVHDWSGGNPPPSSSIEGLTIGAGGVQLLAGAISGTLVSTVFDAGALAQWHRVELTRAQGFAQIPGTRNLLPNPGFEWGERGSLEHWQIVGFDVWDIMTATITSTATYPAEHGQWAFLASNEATNYGPVRSAGLQTIEPITVSAAMSYTLAASFRAPEGTPGTFIGRLIGYDASGQEIGRVTAFSETVSTASWQRYSGTVSFPMSMTTVATVRPQLLFESSQRGHFMLDALQLEAENATAFHEGVARSEVWLHVRAGNTPQPDSTWTRWQQASTTVPPWLGGYRYLQYRLVLGRTAASIPSPAVAGLAISYDTPAIAEWRLAGRDPYRSSFEPLASDITEPAVRWLIETGVAMPPAHRADLDGDGNDEVVFPEAGRIRSVRTIDGSELWRSPYLQPALTIVDIADVDGDGYPDVLVSAGGRLTFHVIDGRSGTSTCEYFFGWENARNPGWHAVRDFTGDGIADWAITQFNGHSNQTIVISPASRPSGANACEPLWRAGSLYWWDHHATAGADVDGDGDAEVVVFDPVAVRVFDGRTGAELARYPRPGIYGEVTALTIADLDGDGREEILAHSWSQRVVYGGNLLTLRFNGGVLTPIFTVLDSTTWSFGSRQRIVDAAHDWNGDGIRDVVFTFVDRTGPRRTQVFDGTNGAVLGELSATAIAVTDADQNGRPELVTSELEAWQLSGGAFNRAWQLNGATWQGTANLDDVPYPTLMVGRGTTLRFYRSDGSSPPEQLREWSIGSPVQQVIPLAQTAGSALAIVTISGTVQVWDWASQQLRSTFSGGASASTFSVAATDQHLRVAFSLQAGGYGAIDFPRADWYSVLTPTVQYPAERMPARVLPEATDWYLSQSGGMTALYDGNHVKRWEAPVVGRIFGFGNFDGTGALDVLMYEPVQGYMGLSGDTGAILWSRAFEAYFPSVLTIRDLNNDGRDDVVVIWGWAINGATGEILRHYPAYEDNRSYSANLDDDPAVEVISTSGGYQVSVFKQDGQLAWRLPLSFDAYETTGLLPAFVDADGDGRFDVALPNATGRLRILRGSDGAVLVDRYLRGGEVRQTPLPSPVGINAVVAVDIDGDGDQDVLAAARDGWLYALRARDGAVLWKLDLLAPVNAIGLGDADGDGRPEVFASVGNGYVAIIDQGPGILNPFSGNASVPLSASGWVTSSTVTVTVRGTLAPRQLKEIALSNDGSSWGDWIPATNDSTVLVPWTLGTDGRAQPLYVGVRDKDGYTQIGLTLTLDVDTLPPSAPTVARQGGQTGPISLTWSATDATSGVASYDLQVRELPDGPWTPLLTETTATSHELSPEFGKEYQFRVRSRDAAGNIGAWTEVAGVDGLIRRLAFPVTVYGDIQSP